MLAGFVVTFMAAAVAAAAPAAAIDDPSRPDARVTHGPSCRPGGLVIEVTAGTTAYSVRLATTRQPAGEDEAVLAAGGTAVLRSGDVAWGETIDGRLEYTAQDGSGATYVDELEYYSFTRPSQEDCEAITAAASPEPTSTASAPPSTAGAAPVAPGNDGGLSAPLPAPSPVSASAAPVGSPDGERTSAPAAGESGGSASTLQVAAEQLPVTQRGTMSLWSLVAAAVALVGSVGGLVSVAGSSRASARRGLASGRA